MSQPDRQLEQFVDGAAPATRWRVHPVTLVVVVFFLNVVAFLLWPTRDELLAHFDQRPPIDLPDPSALTAGSVLPLNATVRLHGVLGNRAAKIEGWRQGTLRMGPIEVRQVLGAPLFVEYDDARHARFGAFSEVDVLGRVTDFGPGTEIPEVREYLKQQGIAIPDDARLIILDEGAGQMRRYVVAWTAGLSLAVLALLSVVRRARGSTRTRSA